MIVLMHIPLLVLLLITQKSFADEPREESQSEKKSQETSSPVKAQSLNRIKVSRGDLAELNRAFSQKAKSDGDESEELSILIGSSILKNPVNFLKAYKKNKKSVKRLDAILGNLGHESVDNSPYQVKELQRRIKALESVKDASLKSVAFECITELKKQLEAVEPRP